MSCGYCSGYARAISQRSGLVNLILYFIGKDYKLAMAAGLSLTALTLCAEYSQLASWVEAEDWAAV